MARWFGRAGSEPPGQELLDESPPAEDDRPEPLREPAERYRAFGKEGARATMLDVRQRPTTRSSERGEILPFAYLLQVTYTATDGGDAVSMLFTTCVVTIAGEGLAGLRQALMRGELDFVQEFDAERWDRPVAGEPLVRSISVSRQGEGQGSGNGL